MTTAAAIAARELVHLSVACSTEGVLQSVRVDGQPPIVVGDDIDAALRRALPSRTAEIVITNSVETPYRCIGGLIYSLQRAGYRHIAFISEPPPVE